LNPKRHTVWPRAAIVVALLVPAPIFAQNAAGNAASPSLVAWEAFKKANESIKDYTETIAAHEVKDGKTEDRVYHFSFQKPTNVRSEIVSGPGSGGAAVWHGGDHVKGHQGGFFRGIKLSIPINDARATDLRGKTIDASFYPTMIADFETNGKLSEVAGEPVNGTPTDDVTMVPGDPAKVRNLTKEVLVISRATHIPVEHLGYENAQLVEDEHFTDIKLNPGLPESTFEM